MKREPARLAKGRYDVVVVGAGIYGACIARDAALRGLRVALVERGDFGGATSHNSFKLIHGGLRYLQHLDFRRVRESIEETRFWLRAAPHLIKPLQFVIPTEGYGTRGPLALWTAQKVHGLIGLHRNRDVAPDWRLPAGRVVSKKDCSRLIPDIDLGNITGGAVWYDAQMQNADRVLLECIIDAVAAGADAVNYMCVEGFLGTADGVEGVRARDVLSGDEFEIHGTVTVNACGPWAGDLVRRASRGHTGGTMNALVKGINLVTRRLVDDYAIGVVSNRPSDAVVGNSRRLYFITPWRNRSLVGTSHVPYQGNPDHCQFTEEDVQTLITEINAAYPPAALTLEDVHYCYGGLTPGDGETKYYETARTRHARVLDHQKVDRIHGFLTVVGVKYTTSRLVAEQAVDLVYKKLGQKPPPCTAKDTPLPGARNFQGLEHELTGTLESNLNSEAKLLLESYGTGCRQLFDNIGSLEGQGVDVLFRRCCQHAVRSEMAVRLTDVVFRRTDLLARGVLTGDALRWCADMMHEELEWTNARKHEELSRLRTECSQYFVRNISGLDKAVGENRQDIMH
jgi:glycerol-3-phosphate dehydrogenase